MKDIEGSNMAAEVKKKKTVLKSIRSKKKGQKSRGSSDRVSVIGCRTSEFIISMKIKGSKSAGEFNGL